MIIINLIQFMSSLNNWYNIIRIYRYKRLTKKGTKVIGTNTGTLMADCTNQHQSLIGDRTGL